MQHGCLLEADGLRLQVAATVKRAMDLEVQLASVRMEVPELSPVQLKPTSCICLSDHDVAHYVSWSLTWCMLEL